MSLFHWHKYELVESLKGTCFVENVKTNTLIKIYKCKCGKEIGELFAGFHSFPIDPDYARSCCKDVEK